MMCGIRFALLFLILLLLAPDPAEAQQRSGVRAQGREIIQEQNAAPTTSGATSQVLDFREEMRRFVQSIGKFARGHRPDFMVIPENGLELLVKIDPSDPDVRHLARTYMRSINGIVQDGLFYGVPELDKPTEEKRRESLLPLARIAKKAGLKVLVGTCSWNASVDLSVNGGPSNASWKPPHPDVIPYEEPFPYLVFQVLLPVLCICCPALAACIRNF